MTIPDTRELATMIDRMEARFAAIGEAGALLDAYIQVCRRFAADLDDPRDVLLSRGGALMLIQEMLANPIRG